MSKLVIVAGPQAAGKSTVISKLGSDPYILSPLFRGDAAPLLFPLQESRQIIVHKYILLGAVSFTAAHELEVIECDLARMHIMREPRWGSTLFLDECNVFTLAHAQVRNTIPLDSHFEDYLRRLQQLETAVLFLDIPPEISWERRRRRYEQRLAAFPEHERQAVMQYYHDYLFQLHPSLHEVYQKLPLRKVMIDASSSPENVLKRVCQELAQLA
jgi:thymidylate kinase